jgi:hypothetical protein
MAVLCGLGAALVLLTGASLTLHIPGSSGSDYTHRMAVLIGLMMTAAAVYFIAARLVLSHALPAHAVWTILGIALVLRLILLSAPPFLSSDIYRYVWDGRVQAAGINPYRYVPADPALATLRDSTIYPMINRPDYARTIYPPAAQLVFALVGRVMDSVAAMKLAMISFETLGIVSLLQLLSMAGLPSTRVLLYVWNPLPLWSFAGDGHADAIVVGLLGLALLLRARRRDGWAGAVLAGATLVKFFPIVVAPAFLRRGRFWRPLLAGAAVVVGLYALYSSAGEHVLGFLPSYRSEEGLSDGSGFWLLAGLSRLGILPAKAAAIYQIAVAAILLILGFAVVRGRFHRDANEAVALCGDAALLMAAVMVAASAHYPWYFAWLALPLALAPSMALAWLATVPLLLYLHPWDNDFFLWPSLIYLPAAALLAVDLWVHRAPVQSIRSVSEGQSPWPLRQH